MLEISAGVSMFTLSVIHPRQTSKGIHVIRALLHRRLEGYDRLAWVTHRQLCVAQLPPSGGIDSTLIQAISKACYRTLEFTLGVEELTVIEMATTPV